MLKTNRLFFIDAVRAFAIIMMLQGHFVDTLIATEYRDLSHPVYQTWNYFRGITAPTFFTISGLVFTYLLMKSKKKGLASQRARKGLIRGVMLIAIGYALRAPVFSWLTGSFNNSFLIVDVLHCIGLSLIFTVLVYFLTFKKSLIFSILMLLFGIAIFITEPLYRELDTTGIPIVFANYISKSNGSGFTIIPWLGYVCLGGFIASIFYRYLDKKKFKPIFIFSLLLVGFVLIYYSSFLLIKLHYRTDILLFKQSASYNYLFTRLGNVMVLLALFYAIESFIKHSIILKIGQKTLSIYVIHVLLLYGSLTGLGLHQVIGKSLNPYQVAIGALLFVSTVCVLSLYRVKSNHFIYTRLRDFVGFKKLKAHK